MCQEDTQYMAHSERCLQCDKVNHLRNYAQGRADRSLEVIIDEKLFMKCIETMRRQRWISGVCHGKIKCF